MERVTITNHGYANLQAELQQLKATARPGVIEEISSARDLGDLSENAEYHAAKEKQGFIEGRITSLEDKISRANVIDVSKLSGDKITFGASITLLDEHTDEEVVYQIVGEDESSIADGKLSLKAPLARALIGRVVGDSVEVSTPRGAKFYSVEKIQYI